MTLDVKQDWGSVQTSITGDHYLFSHMDKWRLDLLTRLSLRVTEGLTVDAQARGSFVNDQISLTKTEASADEIRARDRQLPATFQYSGTLGLTYTMGSTDNNVINPRFGE